MPDVNHIFPSCIYLEQNVLEIEERKKLFDKISKLSRENKYINEGWKSNVNNSHHGSGKFNIHQDKDFTILKNIVKSHVNNFALFLESNHEYNCDYSWFNVYEEISYQEFHIHTNSIFSAVYFLSVPDKCSPLIFEKSDLDMFPLKNIENYNYLNSQSYSHYPIENSLIIFRSNLRHMVPIGNNKNRITLSYNFS